MWTAALRSQVEEVSGIVAEMMEARFYNRKMFHELVHVAREKIRKAKADADKFGKEAYHRIF